MHEFDKLLELVPQGEEREELRRLAADYRSGRATAETLDRIAARVAYAFRAARYPIPDRQKLERMLKDP